MPPLCFRTSSTHLLRRPAILAIAAMCSGAFVASADAQRRPEILDWPVIGMSGDGTTFMLRVQTNGSAYLWRTTGLASAIPQLGGAQVFGPGLLSYDGTRVAGTFRQTLVGGGTLQRGFVADTSLRRLEGWNQPSETIALAISGNGQVVVGDTECQPCLIPYYTYPLTWDAGGPHELHFSDGIILYEHTASAVNFDGRYVAGVSHHRPTFIGHDTLCLWVDGEYHGFSAPFPFPNIDYHLTAEALSEDARQVVGVLFEETFARTNGHPFVYNFDTGALDMLPARVDRTDATGIQKLRCTFDASMVVGLNNDDGEALVWIRDRGVARLRCFLGEAGVSTVGMRDFRDLHLSRLGTTIAGTLNQGPFVDGFYVSIPYHRTFSVMNDSPSNASTLNTSRQDDPSVGAGGSTKHAAFDGSALGGMGVPVETPGVWYRFTGDGHAITITVRPFDSFNPRIHAYCGVNGPDNLSLIAASDSAPRAADERLSFCTEVGTPYYILVSGGISGLDSPTGEFLISTRDEGACSDPITCDPRRGGCTLSTGECIFTNPNGCAALRGRYCGDGSSCAGPGSYEATLTDGYDQSDLLAPDDGFVTLADDASAPVSLPFVFPFYGIPHSSVNVCSNGFVSFGSAGLNEYTNVAIPNPVGPNDAIYALWDDLVPGAVSYKTLGSAPNRRFVLQWLRTPQFNMNDSNTFQIVLFENGAVELRYDSITPQASTGDYTVGVESPDGMSGASIDPQRLFSGFKTVRFEYTPGPLACPRPCIPDFNGDGRLDPDDLSDYIGCFFSTPACPGADWNGDRFTDPDDLADYIGAFFSGC